MCSKHSTSVANVGFTECPQTKNLFTFGITVNLRFCRAKTGDGQEIIIKRNVLGYPTRCCLDSKIGRVGTVVRKAYPTRFMRDKEVHVDLLWD